MSGDDLFLPLSLPRRVVNVLNLQFRQRRTMPGRERLVKRADFIDEETQRPAVADNVMQTQQQHLFGGAQSHELNSPQWTMREIERTSCLNTGEVFEFRLTFGNRKLAQIRDRQVNRFDWR